MSRVIQSNYLQIPYPHLFKTQPLLHHLPIHLLLNLFKHHFLPYTSTHFHSFLPPLNSLLLFKKHNSIYNSTSPLSYHISLENSPTLFSTLLKFTLINNTVLSKHSFTMELPIRKKPLVGPVLCLHDTVLDLVLIEKSLESISISSVKCKTMFISFLKFSIVHPVLRSQGSFSLKLIILKVSLVDNIFGLEFTLGYISGNPESLVKAVLSDISSEAPGFCMNPKSNKDISIVEYLNSFSILLSLRPLTNITAILSFNEINELSRNISFCILLRVLFCLKKLYRFLLHQMTLPKILQIFIHKLIVPLHFYRYQFLSGQVPSDVCLNPLKSFEESFLMVVRMRNLICHLFVNYNSLKKRLDYKLIFFDIKMLTLKILRSYSQNRYYTVLILGRTNVGKSALFNALIGLNKSLSHQKPFLTRNYISHTLQMQPPITFVDSTSLQQEPQKAVERQSKSNLVVYVINGNNIDWNKERVFYKNIKSNKLLVVNRVQDRDDIMRLGINKNFFCYDGISGQGIVQIEDQIYHNIPHSFKENYEKLVYQRRVKFQQEKQKLRNQLQQFGETKGANLNVRQWQRAIERMNDPQNIEQYDLQDQQTLQRKIISPVYPSQQNYYNPHYSKPIRLSIIGRTNVGKSTLLNSLLKQPRFKVSPNKATTTDSVQALLYHKDHKIFLNDTAGYQPLKKQNQEFQRKIFSQVEHCIKYSHVVIYLVDCLSSYTTSDVDIIRKIIQQGRGLVLGINKWDLYNDKFRLKALNYYKYQMKKFIPDLEGISFSTISAQHHQNTSQMLDDVIQTYKKWNTRISTGKLNNWLQNFKKIKKLPNASQNQLKIKYILQNKIRPPSFLIFVNDRQLLKPFYLRFLRKKLSQQFQIKGIPIRIVIRQAKNDKGKLKSKGSRKKDKFNKFNDLFITKQKEE